MASKLFPSQSEARTIPAEFKDTSQGESVDEKKKSTPIQKGDLVLNSVCWLFNQIYHCMNVQ